MALAESLFSTEFATKSDVRDSEARLGKRIDACATKSDIKTIATRFDDCATKSDLKTIATRIDACATEAAVEKMSRTLLMWVVGTLVSCFAAIAGLIGLSMALIVFTIERTVP